LISKLSTITENNGSENLIVSVETTPFEIDFRKWRSPSLFHDGLWI